MHLEGILIHKTPYKDRDVIGKLLLRSGKVMDVYFYGGRGGGKHSKGSILEVGYVLKITLAPRRKKVESNIHIVKEYQLLWESKFIRSDFGAFYLLSLYAEIFQKIAIEHDLDYESTQDEHSGLFRVLSNGVFCLDRSVEAKNYQLEQQLFIFLAKLTYELGILPEYQYCQHCHENLEQLDLYRFEPHSGGFTCRECLLSSEQFVSEDKELFEQLKSSKKIRKALITSLQNKYKDYEKIGLLERGQCHSLFNYFCYQFEFQPDNFKTWKFLNSL